MSAYAALDLRANEQPLPVTRDPQAIAKIPPGYRFVEPGTLTVAISALNSPPLALLASDNRTRIGSDPDKERILLGWNEDNRAAGRPQAQPVYLTDDASGNLYIQSGRADIFFGPQSVAAYKAALNGQTRVVGLGPKKAWVATTTKKGNGLVFALQAALDGAIARGEYQQVLARWGEQGEAVAQSVVNPPGITY
ncbi:hypothetical protein ACT5G5_004263 [Klebsiella pneumoniae]